MFCNVCGTNLPASSAFCPQCGMTLIPESASETVIRRGLPGEQKVAPPLERFHVETTQEQYPYTPTNTPYPGSYYHVVPQDPYNAPPMYSASPPPVLPPQSHPPQRRWRIVAIVGIVIVVLLASCIGLSVSLYSAINSGLRATTTTPYRASTPSTQITPSPIVQEPNPYAPFTGKLVLADTLQDNSQGYKWSEFNDSSLYCQFAGGAYHLRLLPQSKYQIDWCFANNTDYNNLAFQVEMTMSKGDCGGLIFHNAGDRQLYYFCITHLGGYGLYLYYKANDGSVQVKGLAKGDSPLIYTGYNTKNIIGVSTYNGTINLYVNDKLIQSVVNKTFLHGAIGLATHQYDSKETDVRFQNARVWAF